MDVMHNLPLYSFGMFVPGRPVHRAGIEGSYGYKSYLHLMGVPLLVALGCLLIYGILAPTPTTIDLPIKDRTAYQWFHQPERDQHDQLFRWSRPETTLQFPELLASGQYRVTMRWQSGRSDATPIALAITDQQRRSAFEVDQSPRLYHILAQHDLSFEPLRLDLTTSTYRIPDDRRTLGMVISGAYLTPLTAKLHWWWFTAGVLLLQAVLFHGILGFVISSVPWRAALAALWLPIQMPGLVTAGYTSSACWQALLLLLLLGLVVATIGVWHGLLRFSPPFQRASAWVVDTTAYHCRVHPAPTILVVLCCWYLFALSINTFPRHGDEPHYLIQAHSILVDGDFDVLNNHQNGDFLAFYGRDYLQPHLHYYAGEPYPHHPMLGVPFTMLPGYLLAGAIGALVLLCVLMAAAMVCLYRASCAFVPSNAALATTLCAGAMYPIVIYSHQIYPESIAFVLVALALSLILRPATGRWRVQALAVGFTLALLPHLHFKMVLLSATLYLAFLWSQRRRWLLALLWSLAPVLISAFAFFGWLFSVFGRFFFYFFLQQSGGSFEEAHSDGITGLLFDQAHGLFFYAPWYLLALVGFWFLWQRPAHRGHALFLVFMYATYHVSVGAASHWISGATPAPRYIIPIVTILVLFCAVALDALWQRRAWLQILTLTTASFLATFLILANRGMLYRDKNTFANRFLARFDLAAFSVWLPSFRQETLLQSYGLLWVWSAVFLLCWWCCSRLNPAFERWVMAPQG
ncbi:MAG: hypothetical protein HC837_09730 [Chloroflexaceae bacterium]|nr:hypothetical protein [Chloroflexaceae bacterium]